MRCIFLLYFPVSLCLIFSAQKESHYHLGNPNPALLGISLSLAIIFFSKALRPPGSTPNDYSAFLISFFSILPICTIIQMISQQLMKKGVRKISLADRYGVEAPTSGEKITRPGFDGSANCVFEAACTLLRGKAVEDIAGGPPESVSGPRRKFMSGRVRSSIARQAIWRHQTARQHCGRSLPIASPPQRALCSHPNGPWSSMPAPVTSMDPASRWAKDENPLLDFEKHRAALTGGGHHMFAADIAQ